MRLTSLRNQLLRNSVELVTARARFVDPYTLLLEDGASGLHKKITAEREL